MILSRQMASNSFGMPSREHYIHHQKGRGGPVDSKWDFDATGLGSIPQGVDLTGFPCHIVLTPIDFVTSLWQNSATKRVCPDNIENLLSGR